MVEAGLGLGGSGGDRAAGEGDAALADQGLQAGAGEVGQPGGEDFVETLAGLVSRDLDDATRIRVAAMVSQLPGGARAAVLIDEIVPLDAREELVALGDTLPAGLRMPAAADDATTENSG